MPLYEGQPLAADIICYLCERGFLIGGVFNQAVTETFGPTQADVLSLSELIRRIP